LAKTFTLVEKSSGNVIAIKLNGDIGTFTGQGGKRYLLAKKL
jgi:hypothetical protein